MVLERFNFTENYLVGVTDIDRQHGAFFEIYNNIADKMSSGDTWSSREFIALANQLFMYARYHFREEQYIMVTNGYPDTSDHLEQHQFLINCLDSVSMAKVDTETLLQVIVTFVQAWAEHILIMDKLLGEFMKKRII